MYSNHQTRIPWASKIQPLNSLKFQGFQGAGLLQPTSQLLGTRRGGHQGLQEAPQREAFRRPIAGPHQQVVLLLSPMALASMTSMTSMADGLGLT